MNVKSMLGCKSTENLVVEKDLARSAMNAKSMLGCESIENLVVEKGIPR